MQVQMRCAGFGILQDWGLGIKYVALSSLGVVSEVLGIVLSGGVERLG
jgi:hypothetical protein